MFSSMTSDEKEKWLGKKPNMGAKKEQNILDISTEGLADSVDWRT